MLDLGIRGRKAIVCAASKGLGRACAMALARAGVEVTITARTAETLEETAAQIRRETGVKVAAAPGDITTEGGRQAALAACLAAARVNRLADDADYRTPWERGHDDAIADYELTMIRRSASNMRALGLGRTIGD